MSRGEATVGRKYWSTVDSPIGPLVVTADADGVAGVWMDAPSYWADGGPPGAHRDDGALAEVRRQLDEYFAGERTVFDVPLNPSGTPFQLRVWEALREIPYGTVCSYGELAGRLGSPGASRAVGLANGRNPIPIIVPCHRVIGASGALTGYGGGLERKRFLLDLEAGVASGQPALLP
ncbi:MAG: methylated-DNA--[protein]-cysteine S-methyltransferase, partial [Actinomycetota bacterium]